MPPDSDVILRPLPRVQFLSSTSVRFALLVLAILGASLFLYDGVYLEIRGAAWIAETQHCWSLFTTTEGRNLRDPSVVEAMSAELAALEQCQASIDRPHAFWMLGGVGILTAIACGLYWIFPVWKLKQRQLLPLTAGRSKDVLTELESL